MSFFFFTKISNYISIQKALKWSFFYHQLPKELNLKSFIKALIFYLFAKAFRWIFNENIAEKLSNRQKAQELKRLWKA